MLFSRGDDRLTVVGSSATSRSGRSLQWLLVGLLCFLASAVLILLPSLVPGRTRNLLLAVFASFGMIAVHVARLVLR